MSVERAVAEHTARHYAETVAKTARMIRQVADEFERAATPYSDASFDGTPRFSSAAENALHALTWGTTNLNAFYLVGIAARADAAEASLPQENTEGETR